MIDSLRTFGGTLRDSPVWLFESVQDRGPQAGFEVRNVERHTLEIPSGLRGYELSEKVCAFAAAEKMAGPGVRCIVWVSPECLFFQPPTLLDLGDSHDAAFRPVHIRNIGLLSGASPDAFWKRVYDEAGIDDVHTSIETFVEGERIRSYFNSHSFSVAPSVGLGARWLEVFERLVTDEAFQQGPCADDWHKVFLHQAVLSAQVVAMVPSERIRILPPAYNYPYHLQSRIPSPRRMAKLNDVVSVTREDLSLNPRMLAGIDVEEPLRSWLEERF